MSKELVISASSHERRVAILEEGQLVEIYIEREKEIALVGSIYKVRVTRVLPGMQAAFVDIGLDGDAFLYVSDVFENLEDYDHGHAHGEPQVQAVAAQRAAAAVELLPGETISGGAHQEAEGEPLHDEHAPVESQQEHTLADDHGLHTEVAGEAGESSAHEMQAEPEEPKPESTNT